MSLLKEGERLTDFGWGTAVKLPIEIHYREVIPDTHDNGVDVPAEAIITREGTIVGYPDEDFVIQGVDGELYPIKKDIFHKTYRVMFECDSLAQTVTEEN